MSGSYVTARRPLTGTLAAVSCVTTSSSAVQACAQGNSGGRRALQARARSSVRSTAFCQWQCSGQTCRIEVIDGLPVELMDFRIEAEESEAEEPEADEREVEEPELKERAPDSAGVDPAIAVRASGH